MAAHIVTGTFTKFNNADEVGDDGQIAGDSAERSQLLVRRLALVVALEDRGVEDRGMAVIRRRAGHLLLAGRHAVKILLVG